LSGAETFDAAADAYDRHVGRYAGALAVELIRFARLGSGARVLDVGCGIGALTGALAAVVGADRVSGVDPSEPSVVACRTRVPGADVVVAPAEQLPYPDDTFDATFSQLVVNFMSDPEAGVREMTRVTRPGGTVAACVWDYAGDMTLLRAFWDAARDVAPARAGVADEGVVMRLCGEGELGELWRRSGLDDVRSGALTVTAGYDGFEDCWAPFPSGLAPSGAFCRSLSDDDRTRLHDAFRSRLGVGDDPFELTARAWVTTGVAR